MIRAWNGPVISIFGLGPHGELNETALRNLLQCEIIMGSKRQLELLPQIAHLPNLTYPSPTRDLLQLLQQHENRRIGLLASGDPLFFGLGGWLTRELPAEKLKFFPNVSSVQAAFARLAKPWQQAEVLSLHGRSIEGLNRIVANRRYALFTDDKNTPQVIAKKLIALSLQDTKIWVLENLCSAEERIREFSCDDLAAYPHALHAMNVIVLESRGNRSTKTREFPGFTDDQFITDKHQGGMISKRASRLMALALLSTQGEQTCWDIGAGCGGVSVEWAYWHRHAKIYAMERDAKRFEILQRNALQFAVEHNLNVIHGQAPEALSGLPPPHRIFIGGSGGRLPEILRFCWQALLPHGCMVISIITEATRNHVYQFCQDKDCQWQTLQSSSVSSDENGMLKPGVPVTFVSVMK